MSFCLFWGALFFLFKFFSFPYMSFSLCLFLFFTLKNSAHLKLQVKMVLLWYLIYILEFYSTILFREKKKSSIAKNEHFSNLSPFLSILKGLRAKEVK